MPKKTDKSVLTKKSQVTVPKQIREVMGIGPGDQVRFKIEEDRVCLEPIVSDVVQYYGAVKPKKKPEDFKKVRASTEKAVGRNREAK